MSNMNGIFIFENGYEPVDRSCGSAIMDSHGKVVGMFRYKCQIRLIALQFRLEYLGSMAVRSVRASRLSELGDVLRCLLNT